MAAQANQWCLWRARQLRGDGDLMAASEWEARAASVTSPDPQFEWPAGFTRDTALAIVRLDAMPDLPGDASDHWILGGLTSIIGGDEDGVPDPDEISDEELERLEMAGEGDDIWDLDDDRQDAGYNPNRASDGKFAPGANKARTKTPRARSVPKFDEKPHRDVIKAHKAEELKHRNAVIRLKDEQARLRAAAKQVPTKERVGLRDAHAELGRQREASRALANAAKERRVAASKEMIDARREHAASNRARRLAISDARRHVIATTPLDHNAGSRMAPGQAEKLHSIQFSPEVQTAIREHHNAVLGQYGLHDRDAGLVAAKAVEVRTDRGMGSWGGGIDGAAGLHWASDGRIALDIKQADALHKHAMLSQDGIALAGRRHLRDQRSNELVDAYRISTHEAVHGHGPDLIRVGPHNLVEEMSTEMVARKVTGDVHGIPVHQVGGAYGEYINPAVSKLSQLSGRSRAEAHEALASASIKFKRSQGRLMSPTDAMFNIGKNSLLRLGVTDARSHQAMYDHMASVAAKDP